MSQSEALQEKERPETAPKLSSELYDDKVERGAEYLALVELGHQILNERVALGRQEQAYQRRMEGAQRALDQMSTWQKLGALPASWGAETLQTMTDAGVGILNLGLMPFGQEFASPNVRGFLLGESEALIESLKSQDTVVGHLTNGATVAGHLTGFMGGPAGAIAGKISTTLGRGLASLPRIQQALVSSSKVRRAFARATVASGGSAAGFGIAVAATTPGSMAERAHEGWVNAILGAAFPLASVVGHGVTKKLSRQAFDNRWDRVLAGLQNRSAAVLGGGVEGAMVAELGALGFAAVDAEAVKPLVWALLTGSREEIEESAANMLHTALGMGMLKGVKPSKFGAWRRMNPEEALREAGVPKEVISEPNGARAQLWRAGWRETDGEYRLPGFKGTFRLGEYEGKPTIIASKELAEAMGRPEVRRAVLRSDEAAERVLREIAEWTKMEAIESRTRLDVSREVGEGTYVAKGRGWRLVNGKAMSRPLEGKDPQWAEETQLPPELLAKPKKQPDPYMGEVVSNLRMIPKDDLDPIHKRTLEKVERYLDRTELGKDDVSRETVGLLSWPGFWEALRQNKPEAIEQLADVASGASNAGYAIENLQILAQRRFERAQEEERRADPDGVKNPPTADATGRPDSGSARPSERAAEGHEAAGTVGVQPVNRPTRQGELGSEAGVLDVEAIRRVAEGKTGSEALDVAREIVTDFGGEIEASRVQTRLLRQEIDAKFDAPTQEDMIFYMERTANPKLAGDSAEALRQRLSPEAREYVDGTLKPLMDKLRRDLVKHGLLKNKQHIEDYISHLWVGRKWTKRPPLELVSSFMGKGRASFLKKRTIPTYFEGMTEHDLIPRTTRISEIVSYHQNSVNRVIASEILARELKKPRTIGTATVRLLAREKNAPEDYIPANEAGLDHPALKLRYVTGKGKEARPVDEYYRVHPDIVEPLQKVFESPYRPSEFMKAIHGFNMLQKRLRLSISAFHMFSLGESAFFTGGIVGPPGVSAWRNVRAILQAPKLVEKHGVDATRHGLQIHVTEDISRHFVDTWLDGLGKQIEAVPGGKLVTAVPRTLGKLQRHVLDKALWEHMHTGLKLNVWNRHVENMIRKQGKEYAEREGSWEAGVRAIKKEAATFVNDAFGGQNWWAWHRMMRTSKQRRVAQFLLLAPDWTFSNLRVFARGVAGLAGIGPKSTRGSAARYLLRGIFAATVLMDAFQRMWLNFALSDDEKKELQAAGKGFGIIDNERFGIRYGKDDQGRWVFIEPMKQMREILTWFQDPVKIVGAKASPVIQEAVTQLTSHQAGSGFPAPWEGKHFWESLPERLSTAVSNTIPFSLSGGQFMFMLPSRLGLTQYQFGKSATELLMEYALQRGNVLFMETKLPITQEEIIDSLSNLSATAVSNNLDVKSGIRLALSGVRGTLYKKWMEAIQNGDEKSSEEMAKGLLRTWPFGSQTRTPWSLAEQSLNGRFEKLLRTHQVPFTQEEWERDILPREMGRFGSAIEEMVKSQ